MTPVRFSIAVLGAIVFMAAQTPDQQAGIAPAEYQARRAALAKSIGPDALLIAFSSEPARRTGDVDWPFRQEDNLLYLTGMNEPDTTLVLLPGERERREIIFARDRDPSNERWTGHRRPRRSPAATASARDLTAPPTSSSTRCFRGAAGRLQSSAMPSGMAFGGGCRRAEAHVSCTTADRWAAG
jgi:hypothetical protein